MSTDLLCPPADLGLTGFSAWRRDQPKAVQEFCSTPDIRFLAQCAGTGFGKTLSNMANAMFAGSTVYLTITKALQDQIMGDFSQSGLVDIRGQNNYTCRHKTYADNTSMDCETGGDYKCRGRMVSDCPYKEAVDIAKSSQLVTTNYAYWVATMVDPFKQPDLLILDEAHNAHDELCSLMSVQIRDAEVFRVTRKHMPKFASATEVGLWAVELLSQVQLAIDNIKARQSTSRDTAKELKLNKELARKLSNLSLCNDESWVIDQPESDTGHKSLLADPVWGTDYAEMFLFRGTNRILLTSATLCQKTLDLLGIPSNQSRLTHYSWDFPPANQPVYVCPQGLIDHRMDEFDELKWLSAMTDICLARPDRKGIIHSISYDRAKFLAYRLGKHFSARILTHESGQTATTIQTFKQTKYPYILISPSVGTGYDFPGAECEFQIIPKVPFPDTRAKVVHARCKRDPSYTYYLISQSIAQMSGRGRRYADDRCETFILDGHFPRIYRQYRNFFPPWFYTLVRTVPSVSQVKPLRKI